MQVISLSTSPIYEEASYFSIILRKLPDSAVLPKYFGQKVESDRFFAVSPGHNIYYYDLNIASLPIYCVSFDSLSGHVGISTFLEDVQTSKTVDGMAWWAVYRTLSMQASLEQGAPAQVYKWTVSKKGVSYVCA